MKLTDSTGRVIESSEGNLVKGLNTFTLNKNNNMTPGIYFIQMISGNGQIYTSRIIMN